jgi:S-DNA-T family DNA segregation ATPase FtsK/SpoIIIE
MKIGYNRAARIMEMLEKEGIVGPPGEAGKPREVIRRR